MLMRVLCQKWNDCTGEFQSSHRGEDKWNFGSSKTCPIIHWHSSPLVFKEIMNSQNVYPANRLLIWKILFVLLPPPLPSLDLPSAFLSSLQLLPFRFHSSPSDTLKLISLCAASVFADQTLSPPHFLLFHLSVSPPVPAFLPVFF